MKKLQILLLSTLSMLISIETVVARDGCGRGWRKSNGICHLDTNADRAHDQQNDFESKIASISAQNLIDQFGALSAAGVANISNLQIAAINNSIIPFISNDQIIQFTTAQIPALSVNQILAFRPSQIASLTTSQIAVLPTAQIQALLPAQVAALPKNSLSILLSRLIPAQIICLTKRQIEGLSTPELGSQLGNLALHQIEYIYPAQLSGLLPVQIASINENQINNMTKEQLLALKTILQNPAIITTSNNPALATQLSAIALAPGKGFTGDDNPVKTKRKDDRSYIGSTLDKKTGLYELNRLTGVAKTNAAISKSIKKTNAGAKKFFGIK